MDYDHLFCFSPAIQGLLTKALTFSREILQNEAKIPLSGRKKFLYNRYIYPLHLTAFEHPSKLGYFDSELLEIGIHKMALLYDDTFLKELLRHEIAHYLTYLAHGNTDTPHGPLFAATCAKYGWDKEKKATLSLKEDVIQKKAAVMERIEKLLRLSKSANVHESAAALEMASTLLHKHQLSRPDDQTEEFVVKRIVKQKKASQKLATISKILRQFFVFPVMNHGKGAVYLEVFGKEEEVLVAEYVASFLDRELEALWEIEKKHNPRLRGTSSKNSFFYGVGEGFRKKTDNNLDLQRALISTEKALEEHAPLAYPHLRNERGGRRRLDPGALHLGKAKGANLHIPDAVCSSKHSLLIGFC